jgi:hypothetical protein
LQHVKEPYNDVEVAFVRQNLIGHFLPIGLHINPLKSEEIRVNTLINRGLKLNGVEIKNHQICVIWAVWWLKMEEPVLMLM